MKDYIDNTDIKFINPYNFIPLSKEITRKDADKIYGTPAHEAKDKNEEEISKRQGDLITGKLVCRLTAETPLAILDTSEKSDKDKHGNYKAFKLNGTVTIPGSAIRGMIRSEYETVTNSCFVTSKSGGRITTRSKIRQAFTPVIIRRNDSNSWELFEAERIPVVVNRKGYKPIFKEDGEEFIRFGWGYDKRDGRYFLENSDGSGTRFYYGERVKFDDDGPKHRKEINGNLRPVWKKTVSAIYDSSSRVGTETGYLYIGETFDNKHADGIFKEGNRISVSDEVLGVAIRGLEEVILRAYQNESINRNYKKDDEDGHKGYAWYETAKNNGVILAWYDKMLFDKSKKTILNLSPAALGRFAYTNDFDQISKNHSRCTSRNNLCPACMLFGMTGDKNKSKGSNVRFTDALFVDGSTDKPTTDTGVILKELAGPKPSYLQFYSKDGKSYDADKAEIRGRKYYFHNPEAKNSNNPYLDIKETERNSTVELINPGATFEFEVYFDAITDDMLKVLKYVLTLGGNSANMHKIGHGKPIGLGSAKIEIINEMTRSFSDYGYNITENKQPVIEDIQKIDFVDEMALKTLLKITQFDLLSGKDVRYPYISGITQESEKFDAEKKDQGFVLKENALASHQWFGKNDKVLPGIDPDKTDEEIADSLELCAKDGHEPKNNDYEIPVGGKVSATVSNINGKYYELTTSAGIRIRVHESKVKKGLNIKKDSKVTAERRADDPQYGQVFAVIEKEK